MTTKEFIKARAKDVGISLQDIATALELKSYPSFLRTIEKGENLKAKQLVIIAGLLNCTIDELLAGEIAKNDESNDELTIHCEKCGSVIKYKKI